jgi:myo-inositol 2-dehydrogenase/D-chiro-inositol 1-dehydrogenase
MRSRQLAAVRLTAFVDVRESSAQTVAEAFPGAYATTDVERIWRDDAIDAVLISTHHDSHPALAIAAAQAGKHVFVEKPLALTVEDCERVEAAVSRAGVQLMVGFKMRFMPAVQEVRRKLPKPLLLVGQMMDNRWPDHSWAQDPRTGGGNVLSQGVHNLDLLYYLASSGEPESIYAAGGTLTHRGAEVIDNVFGVIRFAGGCVASVLNGDAGSPPYTSKFFYEIFDGARTATLYERCHRVRFTGVEPAEVQAETQFPNEDPEGFVQELAEFVDCVRHNRAPTTGARVADGTRATRLALAAFQSVRSGLPVRW